MSDAVIVVGAGILGLATAYTLARMGVRPVRVIDRYCPGAGASGRSGALLRSNYDNETEARLAEYSLAVFRDFGDRVGGVSGFNGVGLLVPVPPSQAATMRDLAARQRAWGVDIAPVNADRARALAPRLRTDDAALILHQPTAGYCDPNAVLDGYLRRARDLGVTIDLDRHVLGPVIDGERVTGVRTATGTLPAGAVVVAAGVWTSPLLPPGLDLGLVPQLTRVSMFRPFEVSHDASFPIVVDMVQDAWFRPMPGGAVLVGSESGVVPGIDPEQIPSAAPAALVDRYRDVLTTRFDVSPHAAPRGSWAGAFMLSPDHRPVVGAVPGVDGLYIAGGDSGGAFKTAPGLALGLAEVIADGAACSVDIADLSPARLLTGGAAAPHHARTISR